MTEFIQNLFSSIFGNNVVLATILIAMIPIIELKGAIPFSMSQDIWGINCLNFSQAFLWSLLGSSLVVPILFLIYKPIIKLLKKTKLFKQIALKIENKINSKKQQVEDKISFSQLNEKTEQQELNLKENVKLLQTKSNKEVNAKKSIKATVIKVLSVFIFVAIPLPFTGVYTGSCLAVALGLNFFLGCTTVILGNIVAGVLVTYFSSIFSSPTTFLYIFLALIIVFAIFYFIKKKLKIKNEQKNTK